MTSAHDVREEHPLLSPETPELLPNFPGDNDALGSNTISDNLMLPAGGKPDNLEEEIAHARSCIVGVVWEEVKGNLTS